MRFPKLPLAAIVALVIAAVVVAVVLLGDEGKGSRVSLAGLQVTGSSQADPLLYPAFRPGLESYVARCGGPKLDLALETPRGAEATVAGKTVKGTARVSVPVEPGHD